MQLDQVMWVTLASNFSPKTTSLFRLLPWDEPYSSNNIFNYKELEDNGGISPFEMSHCRQLLMTWSPPLFNPSKNIMVWDGEWDGP